MSCLDRKACLTSCSLTDQLIFAYEEKTLSNSLCIAKMSLLNSASCVLSILVWVAWVQKNLVMGQKNGAGGVGLRCFVKKILLKISQSLQENTCAGVSC